MTSDDSTTKSESTPNAASTPSEGASKLEGARLQLQRGRNQKPVTGSYKDNWNRIFGKKKTKRCR